MLILYNREKWQLVMLEVDMTRKVPRLKTSVEAQIFDGSGEAIKHDARCSGRH